MRAWEFGLGGLLAVVTRRWSKAPNAAPAWSHGRRQAVAWAGLVLLAIATLAYDHMTPFPGWTAAVPVVGTLMVLFVGSLPQPTKALRVLATWPLQQAGRLSYSWYLWHWPLLVLPPLLVGRDLSLAERLGCVLLSLLAAEASYRLVESPIRHHAWLKPRPRLSLAVVGLFTIATLGMSLWVRSSAAWQVRQAPHREHAALYESLPPGARDARCTSRIFQTDVVGCAYGDTTSARTVVLFGDSHAQQWLPALEQAGAAQGFKIVTRIKESCAPLPVSYLYKKVGTRYPQCTEWRAKVYDDIIAMRPEVVFVSSMSGYASVQTPPPAGMASAREWRVGAERAFAVLQSSGATVIWVRDTPGAPFNVCLLYTSPSPRD